jgi:hypothetical protein
LIDACIALRVVGAVLDSIALPPGKKMMGLKFGIFKSFTDPYSFDMDADPDPAFFRLNTDPEPWL